MNPRDFGPGHWVATRLPDGRYVMAPWDDPVAAVIRRLNAARLADSTAWGDPADWAAVTAWMDAREPLRPRLLDLFCGAGGASMGYHRAGFCPAGVDLEPMPAYPHAFAQADAIEVMRHLLAGGTVAGSRLADFAAIHASPPCIRWTALPLTLEQRERHPDLITPLRPLLVAAGLPYVIENVPRAPLRDYTLICGAAMGLKVIVHRHFETNWLLMSPGCACPKDATTRHGFVNRRPRGPLVSGRKAPRRGEDHWREAAGLEHLTGQAARNAIPPVYTEYIGAHLLDHLARERAA